MSGTVICVRFGETELAGLDALQRDWSCTRSRAIRRAVAQALMTTTLRGQQAAEATSAAMLRFFPTAFDTEPAVRQNDLDLPETPSGDRSESDVVPPPATQRLPVPSTRSRSQRR